MTKTTQVAADRAHDQTKTVLPAEVARGVYMQHAPSLSALKLMHLMIGTAAGRMADDTRHEFRLSAIRKIEGMDNLTRKSVVPLFAELRASTLINDDPSAMRTVIGGLLDEAVVDYRHEVSGDTLITWTFGSTFRRMAAKSNHWAILDRQTVFHLTSKYSVLLFQHISSLTNLKHTNSKIFTIPDLRAMFGVPDAKHKRFAELNRWTIQPAIAEISQLSRLTLTATFHKVGRTVANVEIAWEVKPDPTETKRELDRPKVGRKARRDGKIEMLAPPFPNSGGLAKGASIDAHWRALFEANVTRIQGGHLPDSKLVCDAFRKVRGDKLDDTTTEKHFVNFCKAWRG